MPLCSACRTIKPVEQFYHDTSRSTGVSSRCRECERETKRQRYAAHPERQQEHSAAWREANREQKRARDRAYQAARRAAQKAEAPPG